jgi:Ca2+-binding RTX toxin-like protein
MTVTINTNFAGNSVSYNFSLQECIIYAQTGINVMNRNLNIPDYYSRFYQASNEFPSFYGDFLLEDLRTNDRGGFETNDRYEFWRTNSGNSFGIGPHQYGVFASGIGVDTFTGNIANPETLDVRGMFMFGNLGSNSGVIPNTINAFTFNGAGQPTLGTGGYLRYDVDYTGLTDLIPRPNYANVGDTYTMNGAAMPGWIRGFNLNFDQFMSAAVALRAGNGAPLDALLNGYDYDFQGGDSGNRFSGYQYADSISGGYGADEFWGGGGNDTLWGGNRINPLNIGTGNDSLYGGGGNDFIIGGDGDDLMNGDAGLDTFDELVGDGFDTINGGNDTDTIRFFYGTTNLYIDERNNNFSGNAAWTGIENIISIGSGDDTVWMSDTNGIANTLFGGNGGDTLGGGQGNDTLKGEDGADKLYGWLDDDSLIGGGGNDSLYGEMGNDILHGGDGADVLDGGTGFDTAWYYGDAAGVRVNFEFNYYNVNSAAGDVLIDIECVVGTAFGDFIEAYRPGYAITVYASYGDDFISSGEDGFGDILDGGENNDWIEAFGGNDWLIGGAGRDRLDGGDGWDTAWYNSAPTGVDARLYDNSQNKGEAAGDVLIDIEALVGSGFNDVLVGNGAVNALLGGDLNDWLDGLGGGDYLYGGNGNDSLIGRSGADKFDGGYGFDTARYDYAAGGLRAYLYDPSLNTGEAAGDTYTQIEGLGGSEFVDDIRGDNGTNTIFGLGGGDLLIGLGGTDYMNGGAGQDIFHFVFISDGGPTGDVIQDFVSGVDRIRVTGASFGLGSPNNAPIDSFRFVAGANATLATSQFIYNNATQQLFYDQDGTGAGVKVLLATLQAGATMAAGDIIIL